MPPLFLLADLAPPERERQSAAKSAHSKTREPHHWLPPIPSAQLAIDRTISVCETSTAVKRIDNFLRWFGLSSIVIGLGFLPVRLFLFPHSWDALAAVAGILFLLGLPCAVFGMLQCDSTQPFYWIFTISKYIGFFCCLSATLAFLFQTAKYQTYLEMYFGSALAIVGLGAFTLSVFCAVLGMKFRDHG